MPFTYKYPRAALTVDCVVFGFDEGELKVLLIERGGEPFKGRWALPGRFVNVDETIDAAARRELEEETGLKDVFFEQLYTFGAVNRDPRERVVSVAHFALVKLADYRAKASTDAAKADWFPVSNPP
jgi:8-oxo-dGTP diphosphatase